MILNHISYPDCFVFVLLLAPQLLVQVGVWETAAWLLPALPSLLFQLPYDLIRERFFVSPEDRSPFVQRATGFQDLVIRCVRYAFAFMPARIGRVFFSKKVALPFLRFRMLRHGILFPSPSWYEINHGGLHGIWIVHDRLVSPDIVVYYCHGGGFSMGSSFFYLEFLLAWVTLLKQAGYKNPAVFALEYTLVPDATYPTQLQETVTGYEHVLSVVKDPSRICISGDSAGATLALSFLLYVTGHPILRDRLPGMACMISPWVHLVSPINSNRPSDYLNARSLERYGRQYCDTNVPVDDPLVSPGNCTDLERWKSASPTRGWFFMFGSEEVLAPGTRNFVSLLRSAAVDVEVHEERGGIHAWPVASLYLGETREQRLHSLEVIIRAVTTRIQPLGKVVW